MPSPSCSVTDGFGGRLFGPFFARNASAASLIAAWIAPSVALSAFGISRVTE